MLPGIRNFGLLRKDNGTAAELSGVAMVFYNVSSANFGPKPRALALRKWVKRMEVARARELRHVARAGPMHGEQASAEALAGHPLCRAAVGKPPAFLRGTILAVCMTKKKGFTSCGPLSARCTWLLPRGLGGPMTTNLARICPDPLPGYAPCPPRCAFASVACSFY